VEYDADHPFAADTNAPAGREHDLAIKRLAAGSYDSEFEQEGCAQHLAGLIRAHARNDAARQYRKNEQSRR
jgi:hypothetical protein